MINCKKVNKLLFIYLFIYLVKERNLLGDLSSGMAFDNRCTCTEQIAECRCSVSQTTKIY